MGLVPLAEARAYVLDRIAVGGVGVERADVTPALAGRVAAADVVAGEDVPGFANSAMDGYAVRAADTDGAPVVLRETAVTLAGAAAAAEVGPGEAVRIMTGAPLPPGADAVVPVEVTTRGEAEVTIEAQALVGQHVRHPGEDVRAGDVVVTAGSVLSPAHVGVLRNVGVAAVEVHRRPRVGVLSTGDELVDDPAAALGPGQLRDSNRHALLALVAAAGAEPVDLGLAPDDPDAIRTALHAGAGGCDAVLSSGGVSMGDVDLVKVVLDEIGAMRWMQVAVKPAKPFAFGTVGSTPVFGLPGNPVSSLVSFELFARPAIGVLAGLPADRIDRPRVRCSSVDGLPRRADGKVHLARVVVAVGDDGGLVARSAGGQASHQLTAMAAANGLALLPDGDGVEPGGTVEVLLVGAL